MDIGIIEVGVIVVGIVVGGCVFLTDHFVGFLVCAAVVVVGRDLRGVDEFFFFLLVYGGGYGGDLLRGRLGRFE